MQPTKSVDEDVLVTQAAAEQRHMVLVIRASDGELEHVWGGPIVPGSDPAVGTKGDWYYNSGSGGSVYVQLAGTWKQVSSGRMILKIVASDRRTH